MRACCYVMPCHAMPCNSRSCYPLWYPALPDAISLSTPCHLIQYLGTITCTHTHTYIPHHVISSNIRAPARATAPHDLPCPAAAAPGALPATTIDALKMKVHPATQPCIDKVLERIGCIDRLTLPEFILAVIRVSTLMPFYADECMSVAVVLTGGLIGLIEKIFLAHSATLLSEALPVGAQERYSYHSGRARTCPDPRTGCESCRNLSLSLCYLY